jgi:CheY-like chemotaxis protein
VTSTGDGLSALDAAISEKPDLILADFSVKGIDIFTFVKKIQRRASLAAVPIVILLPKEADSSFVALQSAGLHAIIKKPLDPILLLKEVKKQMGIVEEEAIEVPYLPITDDFLLDEPATLEEKIETEVDTAALDLLLPEEPSLVPAAIKSLPRKSVSPIMDSEKAEEAIRKIVEEVVERVTWEIVPALVETALPKVKIQSLVEQVVWEIVPPLAEIEIKKEIKRLQPEDGFSS